MANLIKKPSYVQYQQSMLLELKMLDFKGTGSRDRIQIFWKKRIIPGQNKSLYFFFNFEDEPLMSCRLCHFPSDESENIREKLCAQYLSSLPNYLAALLVTPLVHWLNYWLLLVRCSSSNIVFNFVKTYSRIAEKCKHFVRPSNMLCLFTEINWSLDEVILEQYWNNTIQYWNNTMFLFLQYLFNLSAVKMAHHKNILEIQKPIDL